MSLLRQLEGWLERGVEGLFGRRTGGVQPIEIGRRLGRLMEEQKQVSVTQIYAPNAFTVSLSPVDHARLCCIAPRLSEELADHLGQVARRQGFAIVGPLSVEWREEPGLATGTFRCAAGFLAREEGLPEAGSLDPRESTMVFRRVVVPEREGTTSQRAACEGFAHVAVVGGPDAGLSLRLRQGENRLGRAEDNDLVLTDANVSRYHAVITWEDGRARVRDAGSRNGTRLNGETIDEAGLTPKDELQVGLDVLTLRER